MIYLRLHFFFCFLIIIVLQHGMIANAQSARVIYVPGSSQRICQVSGEHDQAINDIAPNQTETRFKLRGNDLGASFEHNGKLHILFGDSIPVNDSQKINLDSIARTNDNDPEDCISLDFLNTSGEYANGEYMPPKISSYPDGVTHMEHTEFRVPVHGFSVPNACPGGGAKMYTFFADLLDPDSPEASNHSGRRSVLSSSCANHAQFDYVYEVSDNKFINIYAIQVNGTDVPNQPDNGPGLLVFGTGKYRESSPYLAYISLSHLEDKTTDHYPTGWRYFKGLDSDDKPLWSKSESEAISLFINNPNFINSGSCIGEFSVHFNQYLQKWLMLYNGSKCKTLNNGIRFQYADNAWGPWSDIKLDLPDRSLVFDPFVDHGYKYFMHLAFPDIPEIYCSTDDECPSILGTNKVCTAFFPEQKPICRHWIEDGLNDTVFNGILHYDRKYEGGGAYGPYIINRYLKGDSSSSTIYYLMSTWNPYQPMLMKSQLRLERSPVARAGTAQTLPADNNCSASTMLDGSASLDPDGDNLTFTWKDNAGTTIGSQAKFSLTLPLGVHTFTLTVDDGLGETDTDMVTITVVDNTPPNLSLVLSPNLLWPPNHRLVPINAAIQATDNCGVPAVKLVNITSNEPDNGLGDGDLANDILDAAVGTNDRSFLIRAERSGKGGGRIYTISYSAEDSAGNKKTVADQVTVPHNN